MIDIVRLHLPSFALGGGSFHVKRGKGHEQEQGWCTTSVVNQMEGI